MALPLYLPDLTELDDPPACSPEGVGPGVMNCRRGTTCGAPWGGIRCCGWDGGGLMLLLVVLVLVLDVEGGAVSAVPPLLL